MRRGRNFATSGPLLLVSLDGEPPGTAFRANGKPRKLQIEAWACGTDPIGLSRFELFRNGQPLRTNVFSPARLAFTTNFVISESGSAWYCARLFGGDPQRQRAVSGAFFFEAKGQPQPAPVPSQVQVTVQDSSTGQELTGSLTEVALQGPLPVLCRKHKVAPGKNRLVVPATIRLRAESQGYEPQTLSPVLDNPALVEFITTRSAEDLVNWETFEQIRSLLGTTSLAFHLKKK